MSSSKIVPGLLLAALCAWIGLVVAGAYVAVLGPDAATVSAPLLTFDDVATGGWVGLAVGLLAALSMEPSTLRRTLGAAAVLATVAAFAAVERDWWEDFETMVDTEQPATDAADYLRNRR